MSEDEVREEFSTFLEQHPDGKIHKREFKKMLEKVMVMVVMMMAMVVMVMVKIKQHPDGKIHKREFKKRWWCHIFEDSSSSIHVQTLPGQDATCMQKHIFRCYDENENGYIDFVEFMVTLQLS